MPSAARREKRRLAKARQAELAEEPQSAEVSQSRSASARCRGEVRTVSTQTPINERVVQEVIEIFWRYLDRRGIDQTQISTQFIIGTRSGLCSSMATLPSSQCDTQSGGSDEEDEVYDSEIERCLLHLQDDEVYDSEIERCLLQLQDVEAGEEEKEEEGEAGADPCDDPKAGDSKSEDAEDNLREVALDQMD